MNRHLEEFFHQASHEGPRRQFHKVIKLHDTPTLSWEEVYEIVPSIPKGWYELSQLMTPDRIDFTKEYWMTKLPFHMKLNGFLENFFSQVDDIGIFIIQETKHDDFKVHQVYSILEDGGFYCGDVPATDDQITILLDQFVEYPLPDDYLAFLQIHDGFRKTTDITGIIPSTSLREAYEAFQAMLQDQEILMDIKGKLINPKTLIPFYESFGMPFYQCFYAEWHPEHEMGNVYYSSESGTISSVKSVEGSIEDMSFPTFTDWLMFYLEQIETKD